MAVGDRRNSRAWERRRNEIVDEAARLFAARGYHATGVAELRDTVGLGRGALYYYIDSKENLLSLIHDRVIVHVLAAGNKAEGLEGTASERLRYLSRELIQIVTLYPDHVWVFLHEYRSLSAAAAGTFRSSRQSFENSIESILIDGVQSGEFKIANTRLSALAWLGLHNYIYIWYRPGRTFTVDMISETFSDTFLNGIVVR